MIFLKEYFEENNKVCPLLTPTCSAPQPDDKLEHWCAAARHMCADGLGECASSAKQAVTEHVLNVLPLYGVSPFVRNKAVLYMELRLLLGPGSGSFDAAAVGYIGL